MSGELSARSSPSFAASPSTAVAPGEGDRHGESTPLRGEAESSSVGVKLRRRWQRRRQQLGLGLGQWRVGDTWALDPRARWVREWNRAYLLACAAGLMVDPLFLYAVSLSGPLMCVFLDGWLAAAVTALRCMVDAMHAWNLVTQLRVARGATVAVRRRGIADEEQAAVDQADADAVRRLPAYARSRKGMALDFFVILPVMQVPPLFSDRALG
jgi:cyclic nucleotide gated channel